MPRKREATSPLLFGHCFSACQIERGLMSSTESPESFHRRCPGELHSDDARRALRCECRCHRGELEPAQSKPVGPTMPPAAAAKRTKKRMAPAGRAAKRPAKRPAKNGRAIRRPVRVGRSAVPPSTKA